MGVYAGENLVAPCYLVSYKSSMDFIRRALGMDVEKLLVPHFGILEKSACKKFLSDALRSGEQLKEMILSGRRQGKTQEEIIKDYKNAFYNSEIQKVQPLKAFNLNAGYLVSMILKEFPA
jgi:hypothetical protein